LRFRSKQSPRGLISQKYQVRLTLMVVALGMVLIGSRVAGRTEFWARIFPESPVTDAVSSQGSAMTHTVRRPDLSPDSTRVLRDDLRKSIKDNAIGVSVDETRAWFVSMGLAERLTAKQNSQLPVARYAMLMDAPDDCRGRAWTVTGRLRRLTRKKLTNDSTEYRNVVDGWLTLPDSGDGLVHVVALQADRDLSFASEFNSNSTEVTVSGYFFKREAYASSADGGLSIAPLLLAGRISRVRLPASAETRADQLTPFLGWLAVLTCGALGLVVWSFAASDAMNRSQRSHELTRLPAAPSFAGLTVETPHERLHQLETAAEAAAPELPYSGL
jgi:hypothetical protein